MSALTRFVPEGAGGLDYTETRRTEQLLAPLGRAMPSRDGAENLADAPLSTWLGVAGNEFNLRTAGRSVDRPRRRSGTQID